MHEDDYAEDMRRFRLKPHEIMAQEISAGRRWSLLQAVAWIACHDEDLVTEVGSWTPAAAALPHPQGARTAALELTQRLQARDNSLSFEVAQMSLLTALRRGDVMAYVDNQETLLTGIPFRGLTYRANMIGLEPSPDGKFWGSVHVNAETVKKFSAVAPTVEKLSPTPVAGRKLGRPPKWKWDEMLGDLIRIADEDSLDTIGPQQADIERWAAAWFAESNDGKSPSEGDIRAKVSKIYQAKAANNQRKAGK